MPISPLRLLLAPASVAIVGASNKTSSLGRDAVEMIVRGGFAGDIFPVNPHYDSVLGLPCYPDLTAIGKPVDLAVLCVAAKRLEEQVAAAVNAGVRALIITANAILEDDQTPCLADRIREYCVNAGIPVCGHNAMGYYNNDIDLRACGFSAPDKGVRGTESIDFDALIATILNFTRLCSAVAGCVAEIDVNPLHVGTDRNLALDALIIAHP